MRSPERELQETEMRLLAVPVSAFHFANFCSAFLALKFLLLNQTFHPDVVSTAQHLTDLALGLQERGHQVTVITSRRAYDDAATQFPRHENWRGITIHRVASTRFGKGAKWRRAADFASFIFLCCVRLLRLPRPDVVVALTSPPLISFIGAGYARLKRCRFVYWVMDLNPDEALAAGWLRAGTFVTRMLDRMSRFSLRRAHRIIALDRFMQARIAGKGIAPEKISVLPPWSHDATVKFDAAGRAAFRSEQGVADKFVVMYSGNHSPCHPLDTLMAAARGLAGDNRFVFLFVGGGSELPRVKRFAQDHQLLNIRCLPYQPLSQLSASLSAADLQVVVMGEGFVGTIHPCKIYNALKVGAPVLTVGPRPSHLTEILAELGDATRFANFAHDDVAGVIQFLRRLEDASATAARRRVPDGVLARFAQAALLPQLIAELEAV